MELFTLKEKLARLNPNLFVMNERRVTVAASVPSYPLMLRWGKRGKSISAERKHYLDGDAQKLQEMRESGQAGEFMCGVSEHSPEYDIFDLDLGTVKMRGWRSLVIFLVRRGICSIERARQVFDGSLGLTDYDNWNGDYKLAKARAEVKRA